MRYQKGQWICECKEPCSPAKKGRTTYTCENMAFRMFPGIQRDSDAWMELYKIRAVVEKAINHFKNNMCIAGRKSRNHLTTKADVYLAGIASQFTVILADREDAFHSVILPVEGITVRNRFKTSVYKGLIGFHLVTSPVIFLPTTFLITGWLIHYLQLCLRRLSPSNIVNYQIFSFPGIMISPAFTNAAFAVIGPKIEYIKVEHNIITLICGA